MTTIATGVIESNQMYRIAVDEQGEFSLAGFAATIRTTGKAHVRVEVKGKVILRGQIAKLLFFGLCHKSSLNFNFS
jgi:hypothetical protein